MAIALKNQELPMTSEATTQEMWIPRHGAVQGCPVGLEFLLQLDKVIVHKDSKFISRFRDLIFTCILNIY